MNAWFDALAARCAEIAARHGVTIDPPKLDPVVAHELLDLTRVVAHTSERQFAPLAAFVAGQAVEGMRASSRALSAADVVAFLADLKRDLPREPAAVDSDG